MTCRDQNELINAVARLSPKDHPEVVRVQASYVVPRADVLLAFSLQDTSGTAHALQAGASLPGGARSINIESPAGKYRIPREHVVDLGVSKRSRCGEHKLEAMAANVAKLRRRTDYQGILSRRFFSENVNEPFVWPAPRQMDLAARLQF